MIAPITVIASLVGALSIMAVVNGLQTESQTITILGLVGIAICLVFYAWIMLPTSYSNSVGKYEAVVFLPTRGHPRPLWGQRYRFAWVARMAAFRMCIRLHSMARTYSDQISLKNLVWHVKSIRI